MKKIYLLFLSFLCLACGKNVNQVAFDYLNANEKYFDKNNYEFVSSELVDTLFQNEYPQSDYYLPTQEEVFSQDLTVSATSQGQVTWTPPTSDTCISCSPESYYGVLSHSLVSPVLPTDFISESYKFLPDNYSDNLYQTLLNNTLDVYEIPKKPILHLILPADSKIFLDSKIDEILNASTSVDRIDRIVQAYNFAYNYFEKELRPLFKKKLLKDPDFRNKVSVVIKMIKKEIIIYNKKQNESKIFEEFGGLPIFRKDNFVYQYHPDSINKYADLELKRRQTILGFEYLFKYRINGKLNAKKLLFNQERDTILSILDLEN